MTLEPMVMLKGNEQYTKSELSDESILSELSDESIFNLVWHVGKIFNRPFDQDSLIREVRALDRQQRISTQNSLSNFLKIIDDAVSDKIPVEDDSRILKYWLDAMNLEISFNPDNIIGKGEIVEIYDLDFIQLYRNHTFYKFCSYDPLTISTTPFPLLFKRSDQINAIVFQLIQKCLANKSLTKMNDPIHRMQEHFSSNSRVYEIDHQYIAPVFKKNSNDPIAFFVNQKAEHIGNSNILGIGKIYDH